MTRSHGTIAADYRLPYFGKQQSTLPFFELLGAELACEIEAGR